MNSSLHETEMPMVTRPLFQSLHGHTEQYEIIVVFVMNLPDFLHSKNRYQLNEGYYSVGHRCSTVLSNSISAAVNNYSSDTVVQFNRISIRGEIFIVLCTLAKFISLTVINNLMYNIFRYKMTNKRDNSMIQWGKFGQVQVYLSVPVLGHDMEHLAVVSQFIPQAEMSCTTVAATQQMKMAVDRFIACVKNDVEICVINIKSS